MRLINKLQTTVTGGALLIASASLVSKVLGFVRDRLLASQYGAGDTLDAYYAAFKLPDLIFNVLVLGALSSSFIPIFIEYWSKTEDRPRAWHITNALMNGLVIILTALAIILIIVAPWVVPWLAPGFAGEKLHQTIGLTRIMLLSVVCFGVSNIFSGLLNAFRRFAVYAIAPIFYNIGIIVGIAILAPMFGVNGLAWGVVLGAALHLIIQYPAVRQVGFRYQPIVDLKDRGVRRILKLMLPRTLGLAVNQLNHVVVTVIGSTLAAGSVTVFNLANNLQSFPIGIVGVSLAVAAFPFFSEALARQDTQSFVNHFSSAFRRILFLIIPSAVLVLLLRAHIVRVVLGVGAFDWQATYLTAQTLGYFSLSLVAQSLTPLLARSFYADKDTRTPVIIALICLVTNIVLSVILAPVHGIIGLAAAFSIANVLNMLLLLAVLRVRHGDLEDSIIIRSSGKIMLATAIMGLVTWLGLRAVLPGINNRTFVGIFLQGSVAGLLGIVTYLILAVLMKFDEAKQLTDRAQKFWQQLKMVANGRNHG